MFGLDGNGLNFLGRKDIIHTLTFSFVFALAQISNCRTLIDSYAIQPRFIIETSLKPVKKMVKKIMGGGGASPPMSPIRGRRRGHSEWRAELEETMKANAKSSTTVKPADSQKHMEFLQRLKSRASMHEF
mmetsp:Transcript_10077/g.15093  ORF Transcript_10077/g.15093 Transcript_10077/m.15093 type:complete len:130 (+) Transcript_10077:2505-2894(+)